ncbi:unnamed protein product, partial [Symbiodinium sp. KB8]
MRALDPVRSSAQVTYSCRGAWKTLPATEFAMLLAEDSVAAYIHTLPAGMNSFEKQDLKRSLLSSLTGYAMSRVSPSPMSSHAGRGIAIGIALGTARFAVDSNGDMLSWEEGDELTPEASALVARTAFLCDTPHVPVYRVEKKFDSWWVGGSKTSPQTVIAHWIEATDWSLQLILFIWVVGPTALFLWRRLSDQMVKEKVNPLNTGEYHHRANISLRHLLLLMAASSQVVLQDPSGSLEAAALLNLQNPGTFGHPESCARNCVLFSKEGACPTGYTCRHCHLPHIRQHALQSQQLRALRKMSDQDRLATFLPILKCRMAAAGLPPAAADLLEILEEHCNEPREPAVLSDSIRSLQRSAKKLPVVAILDLCMHELPVSVKLALIRLRLELGPP